VARKTTGFGIGGASAAMIDDRERVRIDKKLCEFGISRYTLSNSGEVDVFERVQIPSSVSSLGVRFRTVYDSFIVEGDRVPICQLGREVQYVNSHMIESLKGAPTHVTSDFICKYSHLTSLEYSPKTVGGSVILRELGIKSLDFMPRDVGGYFFAEDTGIASLHNFHVSNSDVKIGGVLRLPLHCTHLLSLAFVPGIDRVSFQLDRSVINVIHDIFDWQEKLLDLGLVEQAQL
jgi:hypothetical protein